MKYLFYIAQLAIFVVIYDFMMSNPDGKPMAAALFSLVGTLLIWGVGYKIVTMLYDLYRKNFGSRSISE